MVYHRANVVITKTIAMIKGITNPIFSHKSMRDHVSGFFKYSNRVKLVITKNYFTAKNPSSLTLQHL